MWGYTYYEIRSDAAYSKELPTEVIIKVLENTRSLKRTGLQEFKNEGNFPWLTVTAVNSDKGSYGRPEQFNSKYCNLIDIVTSELDAAATPGYIALFRKIADELNWELMFENEDENTDPTK